MIERRWSGLLPVTGLIVAALLLWTLWVRSETALPSPRSTGTVSSEIGLDDRAGGHRDCPYSSDSTSDSV